MSILISLAMLASGILFFFRIITSASENYQISRQWTKIVTAIFAIVVGFAFFILNKQVIPILFSVLALLLFNRPVIMQCLQSLFAKEFPPMYQILDDVYANMIVGHSFRRSWELMCQSLPQTQRGYFEKLQEHVAFSQQTQVSIASIDDRLLTELCRIDRESHRAKQRMRQLRERYFLQFHFRRKSRQVTAQVRIQALVLSMMYVGLVILQAVFRSWEKQLVGCFAISLILFVSGLYGFMTITKRFRWNI